MALHSKPSSDDARRDGSVRVARRALLTARTAADKPPRVVLHLPDLDALSAVALGPAKPTSHRRLDQRHALPTAPTSSARQSDDDQAPRSSQVAPILTTLLREPLKKFVPQLASGGVNVAQWIAIIQQPKMILAAVVAVGLQLAAVLAMLSGNKDAGPTPSGSRETDMAGAPAQTAPYSRGPLEFGRPIQTPLTTAPESLSWENAARTPPPPWPQTYPAPQPLPGPVVVAQPTAPSVAAGGAEFHQLPQFPTGGAPTMAPPVSLPALAGPPTSSVPSATQPAVGSGPEMFPSATQSNDDRRSTPAVTVGSGSARARLRGTIKKPSDAGQQP